MNRKDLNFCAVWTRTYADKIHQMKLRKILEGKHAINNSQPVTAQIGKSLQSRCAQLESQRTVMIVQENARFLKRLTSLTTTPRTHSGKFKFFSLTEHQGPRTLNYVNRQREFKRIFKENGAFAKRLGTISAVVRMSDHQFEFRRQSKYKNLISKTNLYENLRTVEKKVLKLTQLSDSNRKILPLNRKKCSDLHNEEIKEKIATPEKLAPLEPPRFVNSTNSI